MNEVTEEKKTAVTKSFAIVGFVAIILFAVWLAVQVVSVIPSAFSSLASIADGVYNYNGQREELVVSTKDSVINAGETFTISWDEGIQEGFYSFSYTCTEGVAVRILNQEGGLENLACDTSLSLGDVSSVDIRIDSVKQRFIDVPYTISFVGSGVDVKAIDANSQVTIVNVSIPTGKIVDVEDDVIDITVANTEVVKEIEVVEPTPEPEVAGESIEVPTVVAGTPVTTQEIIYAVPTSNPNGFTDLAITYLGVGILTDSNLFIPSATIATDQTGAFKFEVKNIGTKTSGSWSYNATLPSGIDYSSSKQKPLKPNERAMITIGFEGISQTGNETFGATLDVEDGVNSDIDISNNSFMWAVKIVK